MELMAQLNIKQQKEKQLTQLIEKEEMKINAVRNQYKRELTRVEQLHLDMETKKKESKY